MPCCLSKAAKIAVFSAAPRASRLGMCSSMTARR
ncbi:Uncharacterised protein [Bordetella pertussis]|nr:Uncharacterised protein [Bordetella pertussis]